MNRSMPGLPRSTRSTGEWNQKGRVASPLLTQTYDPYGTVYASVGTGASSYGYTGEQVDANGLVYLRARYYQPGMGRFLSVDPSRQEMNPYLYSAGNPVMFIDPTGCCNWPIGFMQGIFPGWCANIDNAGTIIFNPNAVPPEVYDSAFGYLVLSAIPFGALAAAMVAGGWACLGSGVCILILTYADMVDDGITYIDAARGDPQAQAIVQAMGPAMLLPDPVPSSAISNCDDIAKLVDGDIAAVVVRNFDEDLTVVAIRNVDEVTSSARLVEGVHGDLPPGEWPDMSHEVNPGWRVNPNRQQNCIKCTVAMDATLAGRPTSALPSFEDDVRTLSTLEAYFGSEFQFVSRFDSADIVRRLEYEGHGSRAIIAISRPGDRSGHVLNAANLNGVVKLYEGQIDTSYEWNGDISDLEYIYGAISKLQVMYTNEGINAR
ncbi:MAG: hypothetical protein JXJ17_00770 [Anaerolineae bacterium]|nr:hypothetical protein [Anaerolineae bacterium]